MATPYHVPKQAVPADVFFPGQPALAVNLFVADYAESHLGYERPSDILNGAEPFLPTTTRADEFVVLNADAIMTVVLDAEHEFAEMDIEYAASAEVRREDVEILLSDGSTRSGTLSYLLPRGHCRVQNFLNQEERFVTRHEGSKACFINKRHILRVFVQS
jgi:hypothetical protein